jgi:meso-butanediol dehydrogenase/(S,S)-butanediol dehydrogenase/diacetyl reductase
MEQQSGAILADRVVVVTGAAQGIGAGVVQAVLEAGGKAVLVDLDEKAATAAARRLDPGGARTIAVAADVTHRGSLDRAAAAVPAGFGRVAGWVNNAGIVRMAPAADISEREWDLEFAVNARGVMAGAQAAHAAFNGHGGAIVNIASNAGKVGFPNMAAYNATKAAVINLTRSLAREWAAEGINVNAVCPGSVATPMLRTVADELVKKIGGEAEKLFAGMVPAQLGRHIQPIEVGRVVAFLLSDAAAIIRGQSINIDGGETPY